MLAGHPREQHRGDPGARESRWAARAGGCRDRSHSAADGIKRTCALFSGKGVSWPPRERLRSMANSEANRAGSANVRRIDVHGRSKYLLRNARCARLEAEHGCSLCRRLNMTLYAPCFTYRTHQSLAKRLITDQRSDAKAEYCSLSTEWYKNSCFCFRIHPRGTTAETPLASILLFVVNFVSARKVATATLLARKGRRAVLHRHKGTIPSAPSTVLNPPSANVARSEE